MRNGRCPVDRCEVQGLYQLKGDQIKIHESMCGVDNDYGCGDTKRGFEQLAC